MGLHTLGLRTSGVTIATAALEIRAAAAAQAKRVLVHEIEIIMAAATASVFGVGTPANSGSVAGGTNNPPLAAYAEDAAFSGQIVLAGWTTAPAAPTAFRRRVGLEGVVGARVVFIPTRPIIIAAGASLVLWNITATGVADVNLALED